MFYHFKNCNLKLNNRNFLVSDLQLSQEVKLISPYKVDDRVSDDYLPDGPHIGRLSLKYPLTGQDYLKNFCYADENSRISGNAMGFLFNVGYLTNYNLTATPNNPVEIEAEIAFFDKLEGSFSPSAPTNYTGEILNMYNCNIDNLSNFTVNTLSNISQASFNYNSNIQPSYKFVDTGTPPSQPDRVNILERTISTEITSDSIIMDLPLSGENFGLTLNFGNSQNSGLESIGCSGKISYKSFNISSPGVHSHNLKINQSHLNTVGGISGVITGAGFFNIFSTNNSHPFTLNESSITLVDKIMVGDSLITGFTVTRQSTYDQITAPTPLNVLDDTLTIYATNNTYIQSTPIHFSYPQIGISGLSIYSGRAGTVIDITGSNFYRISNIIFGDGKAAYKTLNPTQIQAIVPYNGTTEKIKIISTRRNLTGTATGTFFYNPTITTVTPVTGVWKDTLTIGGTNFSGVTGVKFGNVNAYNYSILSNSIISVQTPETGAGFPSGYISVNGSGGETKSYSQYNPHVPTYGFNPVSGAYESKVNIFTKVDTGYLYPLSGGYKIKFGNVDTVFYPSGFGLQRTGCLTGSVPLYSNDDYLYIYKPDGLSTYSPHPLQFNVISEPEIYSFTPSKNIRQYQFFTPVLGGKNFRFFFNKSYYFALSGGVNNNVQFYTNIISDVGDGESDSIHIPNVMITGSTGMYSAIVQNAAGSAVCPGALEVKSGINQARFGVGTRISANNNNYILKQNTSGPTITHSAGLAIDGNTGTYCALMCTNSQPTDANPTNFLQLTPKNQGDLYDISIMNFKMNNLNTIAANGNTFPYSSSPDFYPSPSGRISLYEKYAATPIYSIDAPSLSNMTIPFFRALSNPGESGGYTGIRIIKIFTPSGGNPITRYLGFSEIEIY